MAITREMTVGEVLKANPKTADVFRGMGMHCLGCPSATAETIAGAARTHGIEESELLEKLNSAGMGEMSEEAKRMAQPEGAVLQRDKETYAIVPHIPGGVVLDFNVLRKIADVAEKYNAKALKITSAQRIAIVGLTPQDVPKAWEDLGMEKAAAVGLCIRSVKICPGTTFCKRGQQDSVSLGLELDKRFHGLKTPGKMKMAVSGCMNGCSEPSVRDIGVMGTPKGFTIFVGGNAGFKPRLGDKLCDQKEPQEVLDIVEKMVGYYVENAKHNERMGEFIDRVGFDNYKNTVLAE